MVAWDLLAQSLVGGVLLGGVYALSATGLSLIFGVLRVVNFAHGSFMMLGMYIAYESSQALGVDAFASVLVSAPLLFLFGLAAERILIAPILAAPELMQVLITFGLMLFLDNAALFVWGPSTLAVRAWYVGSVIPLGPVSVSTPRLLAFVAALAMTVALHAFLRASRFGRALRAAADDHEGALAVGIDIRRCYRLAFGIGSACAGVAGSIVMSFFYAHPSVGFGFAMTSFVAVVLGGLGSLFGAFWGGMIVGVTESLGAILMPAGTKQVLTLAIFVSVLVLRPGGLFGRP